MLKSLLFILFFRLSDDNRYDMLRAIALDTDSQRKYRVTSDDPCDLVRNILYGYRQVYIDSLITA